VLRLTAIIGVSLSLASSTFASVGEPRARSQQKGGSVDLVQVELIVPKKVRVGKTFRVMDRLENQGQSVAFKTVTGFYLSEDDRWDEKDVLVGGRRAPQLAGQQSHETVTPVTLKPTVTSGNYYFLAVADATHILEERYRENNTRAVAILVMPAGEK
jgi:hypothetical protein